MKINVNFIEKEDKLDFNFIANERTLNVNFGDVCIIERSDIPKEYGLITYTQDRIITIT